jgi:multicomponent Na+:H+ antiporter subunit D
MVLATGAMVLLGVAITVLAGPLYAYAEQAGVDLQTRHGYVQEVLGR